MLAQKLKLTAALLSGLVLTGCTMSDKVVPLNYHLGKSGNIIKSGHHQKVEVRVKDNRGVANPKLIAHKPAARDYHAGLAGLLADYIVKNSVKTGNYVAIKTVASVVKTALSSGLSQMNYSVVKHADRYRFDAGLMSVDNTIKSGFLHITSSMTIKLNLSVYDKKRRRVIWEGKFVGSSSVESKKGVDIIQQSFDRALTAAVRKVQRSHSLVKALSR